jgi:hypothetical protein
MTRGNTFSTIGQIANNTVYTSVWDKLHSFQTVGINNAIRRDLPYGFNLINRLDYVQFKLEGLKNDKILVCLK